MRSMALLFASLASFSFACSAAAPPAPVDVDLGPHHEPPAPPAVAHVPDGARPALFAIQKLYLGDTEWDGRATVGAWRGFGYDIDHRITSRTSTNACRLAVGASKSTHTDGVDGIDNSFGENLLPLLLTTFGEDFARLANQEIADGHFTNLVEVGSVGAGASYTGLSGAFFGAGALAATPTWNGDDKWPLLRSTVDTALAPKLRFDAAYATERVWVSGEGTGQTYLHLPFRGTLVPIPITHVVVTAPLSADGRSITHGVLSAIIPADEAARIFGAMLPAISVGGCDSKFRDEATQLILQAADILLDGTQDPERACDGISIGIGFDAVVAARADQSVDVATGSSTCLTHK